MSTSLRSGPSAPTSERSPNRLALHPGRSGRRCSAGRLPHGVVRPTGRSRWCLVRLACQHDSLNASHRDTRWAFHVDSPMDLAGPVQAYTQTHLKRAAIAVGDAARLVVPATFAQNAFAGSSTPTDRLKAASPIISRVMSEASPHYKAITHASSRISAP